jgi:hypothetical protein
MAVGIFDSGLGGLTVLDAVARRLPDVPFVYFGDNAHAPYGVRTHEDIFNLTCAATERLWAEGCDLVILACNTASAAALKRMQETWVPADKRVLGVFVPLIEALTERQWGDNSPPREVDVKHVALVKPIYWLRFHKEKKAAEEPKVEYGSKTHLETDQFKLKEALERHLLLYKKGAEPPRFFYHH